ASYDLPIPVNLFKITLTRENWYYDYMNTTLETTSLSGNEFSLYETFAFRFGKYQWYGGSDSDYPSYDTRGISLSTDGLVKLIAGKSKTPKTKAFFSGIARHSSLSWNRFWYKGGRSHSDLMVFFRL
ncbi:MAG: hypothetical protein ACYC9O_10980, partial [Candidatus Latescibacterota bacterium]